MQERRYLQSLIMATTLNRRQLMQRAALLGVSMPIFGSLIAACEIDEEDDDVVDDTADDDEPAVDPDDDPDDDVDDTDDDEPVDEPDDEDPVDDAEDVDDEDRYGGRMIAMGHHSIDSLHPDDTGQTVAWAAITQIHDGLVAVDENYEIELELATDYEISDDGLEYTIELRDDVLFHDGEEFNAEDVKYSYEWYMDPDNAAISGADFESVDGIEVTDDYSLVINMDQPDSSFLRRGMLVGIMPEHYHSEVGYDGHSGEPIGTGPYQLVEWNPDDFTLLEAFEDHWRGRPYIDEFEVRIVPEGSVRVLELETGGADTSIWVAGTDDEVRLVEEPHLTSYVTAALAVNNFPMNNTRPQFEDRRVRQALMYALDREQMIETIFVGAATLATANLAPTLDEWYEPDVQQYEYDPDRAIELLEEAGWEEGDDGIRENNGERLEWECLVFVGDEVRRPQAEMAVEYWSAIGAEVSIREVSAASAEMRDGSGDMALHNWTYGGAQGEPDARTVLQTGGGNNFTHFSNDEMDELLEQGVAEVDPEARREIYSQVQQLFAEEVPTLFMMHWDWFNHFNERIQGLPDDVQSGSNLYLKVREMWIQE
jgi:peptide/nickel transport system substrate-binding protein